MRICLSVLILVGLILPLAAKKPPVNPNPTQHGPIKVFVGDSDMFYSTGFASATTSNAFAGHSAGVLKLTINVMKSISEHCPMVTIVQRPDLADYFLRVDHDGPLIVTTKMAAFDRTGNMTFVGITHSVSKDGFLAIGNLA